MHIKNKAVSLQGSTIRLSAAPSGKSAKVMANSPNANYSNFTSSNYNYYMSGLLPATPQNPESQSLAHFYRDIYMHDNIGGSAVDIQSVFPFSDYELRGLSDEDLDVYHRALGRLNILPYLTQTVMSHLVDGFHAGSLIYDAAQRNFADILVHDPLQCNITQSGLANLDPAIHVTTSAATQNFLSQASPSAKAYLDSLPADFQKLMSAGSFVLDPLPTIYVPRRGLMDRPHQSYLHRILPMYLIEKVMYRGTLVEAQRRQRAMSHIQAGDDLWTPTNAELMDYVAAFQEAERDPLGGWVATRNAVQISDLRAGGDFWKWTDMVDSMSGYKLRALGISEALLSGDSSYAAADAAYSAFLETTNSLRTTVTDAVFYRKLFPLLAMANDMYVEPPKPGEVSDYTDLLYSSSHKANLRTPVIHWHKRLTPSTEDNLMETLEKLAERDVPIPLKLWLAAAGVDKNTLVNDAKEDKALKKALGIDTGDEPADIEASTFSAKASVGSRKVRGIMNRQFPEAWKLSKSGNKIHSKYQSPSEKRDENARIVKIVRARQEEQERAARHRGR